MSVEAQQLIPKGFHNWRFRRLGVVTRGGVTYLVLNASDDETPSGVRTIVVASLTAAEAQRIGGELNHAAAGGTVDLDLAALIDLQPSHRFIGEDLAGERL